MALVNRSLANVLRDVVRNLQDLVRSELGLARTGIADEAARVKQRRPVVERTVESPKEYVAWEHQHSK